MQKEDGEDGELCAWARMPKGPSALGGATKASDPGFAHPLRRGAFSAPQSPAAAHGIAASLC